MDRNGNTHCGHDCKRSTHEPSAEVVVGEHMKKQIQELRKIRKRITEIYMELGNPNCVEADSVMARDIETLIRLGEFKEQGK